MDGIVKGQFVGQEGGNFPVDVETFQQLQEYIDGVAELANMYIGEGMNGAILSGCELTAGGTRRNAGWLVLDGLGLVYFVGGLVDNGFSVVEDTINVTAQDVTYPAYKRRRAIAGIYVDQIVHYDWSEIGGTARLWDMQHSLPIGCVIGWPMGDVPAPEGWLLCDGSQYPILSYRKLYNVIGDRFTPDGYEGTHVFNVPRLYLGNGNIGIGYYIIKAE